MATAPTRIQLPRLRLKRHSLKHQVNKAIETAGQYCFDQLTAAESRADYLPREYLRDEFTEMFKAIILRDEAQRFVVTRVDSTDNKSDKVFATSGVYSPLVIGGHDGMPIHLRRVIKEMGGLMEGATWPRTSVLRIEVYPAELRVCVRDRSDPTDLSERVLYPKWRIIEQRQKK